MTSANTIFIAAVLLSYGLLASAKEFGRSDHGGLRKRNMKKMKKSEGVEKTKKKVHALKDKEEVMDDEDVVFWTRILQDTRGKETDATSMPSVPRPRASNGRL